MVRFVASGVDEMAVLNYDGDDGGCDVGHGDGGDACIDGGLC